VGEYLWKGQDSMKYVEQTFQVTLTVAVGLDGTMRANVRSSCHGELAPPRFRWEWAPAHLDGRQLADMCAALADTAATELLIRYGVQESLPM
jgi:hypothetical protein